MNIALINASPKRAESASKVLLKDLNSLISKGNIIKSFAINKPCVTENDIEELCKCQVWIFAFPLYVDGIPSHLLSCLCQIERMGLIDRHVYVYAVANSGFYEGRQCHHALSVMRNWCDKTGLIWGMGIGYGGGGALTSIKSIPLDKGPKRTLKKSFQFLINAILTHPQAENYYTSIAFPEFLYRMSAEIGWWQMMKANGGKYSDLNRRL